MKNEPNGFRIFDPCTCFRPLYTLSLSAVGLGSAWVNYVVIKYNQITVTWNFSQETCSYAAQSCNYNYNRDKLSWKTHTKVRECNGKPIPVFCMHPTFLCSWFDKCRFINALSLSLSLSLSLLKFLEAFGRCLAHMCIASYNDIIAGVRCA